MQDSSKIRRTLRVSGKNSSQIALRVFEERALRESPVDDVVPGTEVAWPVASNRRRFAS